MRPALVPGVAVLLILTRWLWQGTSNVYTKLSLKPYLPDADLGWRRSEDSYLWLGLDVLAICVAVAIGVVVVTVTDDGRTGRLGSADSSVCVHRAPPDNARETQPEEEARTIESGIAGSLPNLPAGRYIVVEQKDAAVAAQMVAGAPRAASLRPARTRS